jgi:hypothetical protein
MPSHAGAAGPRGRGRGRRLRPCLLPLERRALLSVTFPDIAGVTFDASGDVFVSYDSASRFSSEPQESVAEINTNGNLVNAGVFTESGASAAPGVLTTVGSSASLPGISAATDILELQPDGQLFVFNPSGAASSQYDNLASDNPNASNVFDVQTSSYVNLNTNISLANATFGDFGIDGSSLVVSAESNDWDFVLRVTYGSQVPGTATVLVASPASDNLPASPGGVAVDPQGTVLTTLPYLPSGATTAIHVPVAFNLFFDQNANLPEPNMPTLGLTTVPDIDSDGITVDAQDNFILAVRTSSLYGGGPGVAHINSALTAFLADPTTPTQAIPLGISYQNVDGADYLALTDPDEGTYTIASELPLFSGQVSPAQLRQAYGVNQISYTSPDGTTVAGTGAGQTIAIVEEGVDPTLEADLRTFDQFYGIPDPPSFQVVYQNNVTTQNDAIVGEASLDVEWAHAIAPGASIVVYDAAYLPDDATTSYVNLIDAMHEASLLPGVSVVTLSYGEPENGLSESGINESELDSNFTTPGVTFLAASGDSGIYGNGGRQIAANYPAASPDVVSVGGTSITIDSAGDYPGTGSSGEIGWGAETSSGTKGGSGGGLSDVEPEPVWQAGVVPTSLDPSGARALPDVAMDSGVAQEYDVFTSTLSGSSDSASAVGWLGDAGTSAASPIWAGLIAIADQGRALAGGTPLTGYSQTLPALYSLPAADFHDITSGNNGDQAGPGYDLVTGLGTPVANLLVPDLASYQLPSQITVANGPPSSVVANESFGLSVHVDDRLGNAIDSGTVTIGIDNNPGGATLGGTRTVPIVDGLATFSGLAFSQGGSGFTLTVTATGTSVAQTIGPINVTVAPNATRVVLTQAATSATFGQTIALEATVSVTGSGTGTPSGTVTFEEGSSTLGTVALNGDVASLAAPSSAAGTHTITITYEGNASFQPSSTSFQLTINQATPTLTWAAPTAIAVGDPLSPAELDATASFDGIALAGQLVYKPAAGTVLPVGDDQTLTVTFLPADSTDFQSATASVMIDVRAPQTAQPAVIVGEQALFKRKANKKGEPVGKAVLTGFSFRFDEALDASIAENPANYQVDTFITTKVKNKRKRVLHPITNFTVSYNSTTEISKITFTGKETFPNGGKIALLNGVTAGTDAALAGTTAFKITDGGKSIKPE